MSLAEYEYDDTMLTCHQCTLYHKKQGKLVDCVERRASGVCKKPILDKKNRIAYSLVQSYNALFVGEGGINAEGIRLALELEEIPSCDKAEITLKIINYVSTALATNRKKEI